MDIKTVKSTNRWETVQVCQSFLDKFSDALNPEDSLEYYTAKWCIGQSFHDLGLHYLAAPPLLEVVGLGVDKPLFEKAFRALVESAEKAGYYPASMRELQETVFIDTASPEVRDEFNYFMGKFFMEVLNDYEAAVLILENVSDASPLKPKSLYATAVMQASPELKLYKTAVGNFQQAIINAEGRDDDEAFYDVIELGYMALARIAYEAGNYDGALYYYNKVDRFSTRYPRALFESAWTYFCL